MSLNNTGEVSTNAHSACNCSHRPCHDQDKWYADQVGHTLDESIKSCINIKQSCCNAYDTGYDRADHESHGNSKGNTCIHKCASETICPDISSDKDGSENGDEQSEHWKQEVDQTEIVIFRQFHVFFRNQWSQSFRKRLACLGTTFFFFIHRSDIQSEDGY